MAVVQISRIQVRRGRKNSSGGVPQLSSGELAWAVDTQELYIGNGSVAEGAPEVANTKILTEHDNILELASSYRFGNDDLTIQDSVSRSLQSKIDEIQVSVADYGAIGDGSTDCVIAFETALNELFRSADERYEKVLLVPNGEYFFATDLRIPTNAVIRGETRSRAILNIDNNNIRFITETGLESISFDSSNRPRNVNISNLTIKRSFGQMILTGVGDSVIEDVDFEGEYFLGNSYVSIPTLNILSIDSNVITLSSDHNLNLGDRFIPRISGNGLVAGTQYYIISIPAADKFLLSLSNGGTSVSLTNGGLDPGGIDPVLNIVGDVVSDSVSSLITEPAAVSWINTLVGTRTTNILFKGCNFSSNSISLKCRQTAVFETEIKIEDCKFFNNDTAIYVNGVVEQSNRWLIDRCVFEEIHKQGFRSTEGRNTLIRDTNFKNVGNGNGSASSPEVPMVYFGEKTNNLVLNCISDRQQAAGMTTSASTVAVAEIFNGESCSLIDRNYSEIFLSDSFTPLAVFSSEQNYIYVNYFLALGPHHRVGRLTICIGDFLSDISITDEYQYSPPLVSTPEGARMTNFQFNVELRDNDSDSGIDTVVLFYKNPLLNGAIGNISFDITYGV
jgi:hypothetical protein